MNGLGDFNETLGTIAKSVDDNVYSAEEQAKEQTKRLEIDNKSTSIIPQLVRPVTFGWSVLMLSITNLIMMFLSFKALKGMELVAAIGVIGATWNGLVGMMAKFYFQSRGNEKIEKVRAKTESLRMESIIKIEEIKTKTDIKEEVKDNKAERRANKKPFFTRK
tara:strand:- start:319 stop:807 length:489 start_codon:yes stop_codon:yes gene_type:complete